MPENHFKDVTDKKLSVLITGGSGLIGRHLTELLLAKGYRVSHLSRSPVKSTAVETFIWEPEKGIADRKAFDGIDYLIHLAGANLGQKRWTEKRKKEIIDSRLESARLLFKCVDEKKVNLKAYISASGIGYYGTRPSEKIYTEADLPGDDFQGNVCRQWEAAADLFGNRSIRTVKIRTAVVLEKMEGALSSLIKPARFGFLVQTGSGNQYMPWIHIDDVCSIYLKAIEDPDMAGAYNAAAPSNIRHKDFVKTLARVMKRPLFPLPAPAFMLNAVLGEMAELVLKGNQISSGKIVAEGYKFRFSVLEDALRDILNKK